MIDSSTALFPPSPRVIYRRAPLLQVICQLRFPPLLSIQSQPPVEFQERIRDRFPLLEKAASPLPADLPPEFMQIIQAQVNAISPSGYRFLTEDRTSTVTLSAEALALSTSKYSKWEYFRDQLRVPLAALQDIYRPSFFSRIGLRYQDAIDRTALGLEDVPWSKLLRTEILGELALPQFEENLENMASRAIRVKIPDGSGSLLMRHGLGTIQESRHVCYTIDVDFFTEQRSEVDNAERTLNHFNELAGRAFRWCITDTLRDALGPNELASASA